jgi:hypothetical protein
VQFTELPSSNLTLEAFSNGSADIATLTLGETLTLLAQGRRLRILAVMDISNDADAVMIRRLGLKVIAEGVESASQPDFLRAVGCDAGPGYLFARPMPAKAFEAMLLDVKSGAGA